MGEFSRTTGDRNVDEDLYRLRQDVDSLKGIIASLNLTNSSPTAIEGITDRLEVGSLGAAGFPVSYLLFDSVFTVNGLGNGGSVELTSPAVIIVANLTVTTSHWFIFADATAGNIAITLPAATATHLIAVKKIDLSVNTVTVTRAGADLIDGAATKVLTLQWESYFFVPDRVSNWGIF